MSTMSTDIISLAAGQSYTMSPNLAQYGGMIDFVSSHGNGRLFIKNDPSTPLNQPILTLRDSDAPLFGVGILPVLNGFSFAITNNQLVVTAGTQPGKFSFNFFIMLVV